MEAMKVPHRAATGSLPLSLPPLLLTNRLLSLVTPRLSLNFTHDPRCLNRPICSWRQHYPLMYDLSPVSIISSTHSIKERQRTSGSGMIWPEWLHVLPCLAGAFFYNMHKYSGLEFREVGLITEKLPTTSLLSGRYLRSPGCRFSNTIVIMVSLHDTRLRLVIYHEKFCSYSGGTVIPTWCSTC